MLHLKYLPPLGRRLARAGRREPLQNAQDRLATLGWICMAIVVVAALLAASYAAL